MENIKKYTFPEPLGQFQQTLAQSILRQTLLKGIQVFSNEGTHRYSRGDNRKKCEIILEILKILFSRTTCPISTKLGTKHPMKKGIQVFQMKGHTLFQGEMIAKM